MTILITADIHLSSNPRDRYRHKFMLWLREVVKKHHVSYLIVLGDLTELKDNHGAELVNEIVDYFYQLSRLCFVIIERGNHDYLTDSSNPFFQFLKRLPNVMWINQPTPDYQKVPQELTDILGSFLFLPHTLNYKRDWSNLDFRSFRWIFAHNTFEGIVSNGFKLEGIPLSVFPKGVRVISGDVHVPQTIGPVTYVGAPYRVDFGDDYEPRVLLITGDGADGGPHRIKSIPVPGPQKRLVEVSSLDQLKKQPHLKPDDILKVRVTIDQSQYPQWPEIREAVKTWGQKHGFIVDGVVANLNLHRSMLKQKKQHVLKSDQQFLKDYCERRQYDDRILKTGLWISRKA